MKCTKCKVNVLAGLIRCGNCGTATPSMKKHRTSYEYRDKEGKERTINLNRRNTTSLKKNDRHIPSGMVHAYNMTDESEG